jgi:hypothetical protein
MDHCPNVVVDARAAGCQIICSSSGGTTEIAGDNAVVIQDMVWDYLPFKLYEPPPLDFLNKKFGTYDVSYNIIDTANSYLAFFESIA